MSQLSRGWSPWRELRAHPDIWVHRCQLDEGRGWWCPAERVILLDERLGAREARCVLAHELGHAVLGHEGCRDYAHSQWLARRMEVAADRWAAVRLVSLEQLARAVAAAPQDVEQVAAQTDVTVDVLQNRLTALSSAEATMLAEVAAGTGRAA